MSKVQWSVHLAFPAFIFQPLFLCCSPREEQVDTDSNSRLPLITYEILSSYVALWVPQASAVAQSVKSLPAMRVTWVWSLGWEDPPEKEMATHSRILAWRIPWTEEPGGLQSMGSQRVGHDWVTTFHLLLSEPQNTYLWNRATSFFLGGFYKTKT